VVLDEGRVVETGTHDELMARGGLYRRMFDLQAEGYRDDAINPLAAGNTSGP
jgi:ATP-binding cassette, subfamily B, bacterial